MKIEQLKRIFEFLEEKEGHNAPVKWKLINNIPLIEEDLNVKGDLNLINSKITSLPEGLKVGGFLGLTACKGITSLPKGLQVGGNLYLTSSNITSLPKGLKVGGDLILYHSKITSLPEGLKVGGFLGLTACKGITSLPKGLQVGGGLFIRNTPLEDYSDEQLREMIKPGFIKGKIDREWKKKH